MSLGASRPAGAAKTIPVLISRAKPAIEMRIEVLRLLLPRNLVPTIAAFGYTRDERISQHRGQHAVRRLVAIKKCPDVDDYLLAHVDAAFQRGRAHVRQQHHLA